MATMSVEMHSVPWRRTPGRGRARTQDPRSGTAPRTRLGQRGWPGAKPWGERHLSEVSCLRSAGLSHARPAWSPGAARPTKGATSGRWLSAAEAGSEGAGGSWLSVDHTPSSLAASPSWKRALGSARPCSPHCPRLIPLKPALAALRVMRSQQSTPLFVGTVLHMC